VIPQFIRTPTELQDVVVLGSTVETVVLDFKANYDERRSNKQDVKTEAQLELCRDVAQFANTDGGCLVVGVPETRNAANLKVAAKFDPVGDGDGLRDWIETAIRNHLVPSTISHDVALVPHGGGTIVTVNVPAARHLVSIWDKPRIECVYRTSHGRQAMNPDEMERHLMNTSRASELAFRDVIGKAGKDQVELAGGVRGVRSYNPKEPPIWLILPGVIGIGEVNDAGFELAIPVPSQGGATTFLLFVPFDLLRSVWVAAPRKVGIMLNARIIMTSTQALVLEPFEAGSA